MTDDAFQAYMSAAETGDVTTLRRLTNCYRRTTAAGTTALMAAASHGHLGAVSLLAPHESTMRDRRGYTALMYSIEKGSMEILQCLSNEINISSDTGITALEIAMQHRQYKLAETLYPLEQAKAKVTPLMWESFVGNVAAVHQYTQYAKCQTSGGMTALMFAAIAGCTECVKALAKHEMKLRNNNGLTALMFAATYNCGGAVSLLLKEVGMRDNGFLTALMRASKKGSTDAINVLAKQEAQYVDDNDNTALMFAALSGTVAQSAALIPKISSWTNAEGRTALMIAARAGDLNGVKLLIPKEKGIQDNQGMTALMFATQAGHLDVIKELMNYEAEMQSSTGKTALMFAVEANCQEAVDLLIPKEARKQDNLGTTALIAATSLGLLSIATRLFPYEKLIVRKDGSTALMTALQSDNTELVALCMEEAGLKTEFEDTALNMALQLAFYKSAQLLMQSAKERELIGMTDLMVAAFCNDIEAVKRYAPTQKMMQDKQQRTALMYAAMKGNTGCISPLIDEGLLVDINGWTADTYSARYFHDAFTNTLCAALESRGK